MNLNGIRVNRFGLLVIFVIAVVLVYYANVAGNSDRKSETNVNIRQLIIGSVEAAVNGGKEVVLISESKNMDVKSKGKTKEGADNPVTNADLRSHCAMYYGLNKMFPHIKIISEETVLEEDCPIKKSLELDATLLHSDVHKLLDEFVDANDVTVWIDPLDATQEYTERLFHYVTTMVCVAVKGRPVVGVIHFPFTSKTYWAWLGNTASDDLVTIKNKLDSGVGVGGAAVTETDAPPVFVVSRSHAGAVANVTRAAFGPRAKVIPAGGAGYKAMQLVHRNATGYVHTTRIKKWDICAGNAILDYLGGRMTRLRAVNNNHDQPDTDNNNQDQAADNNEDGVIDYSAKSSPVNEGGLLAALTRQEYDAYKEKFKGVF